MKFRTVQALSVSVPLLMWVLRAVAHPKLHPMMLIVAVLVGVVSEVSYRLGRAEREHHVG